MGGKHSKPEKMSQIYPVPTVKCSLSEKKAISGDHIDYGGPNTNTGAEVESSLRVKARDGKFYYGFGIDTGNQILAGTLAKAYICLTGDKAQSKDLCFEWPWQGVGRGSFDVALVTSDVDLGDILVVSVGIPSDRVKDDWYVNTVTIYDYQTQKTQIFPCYNWISAGTFVSCTEHTTTRNDVKGNEVLIQQRETQLVQRRGQYKWKQFPMEGLPSGIDDSVGNLPANEQFGAVKDVDFYGDALSAFVGLGKRYITLQGAKLFITVNELSQYEQFATTQGGAAPIFEASRWTSDAEFGRQMLNGVNPVVIERYDKHLPNFPVKNEMVQSFLVRNMTLEEEMNEGHIYICNMKMMDGLTARHGYYNCAPICMLYVDGADQLVPIAIQLKQGVRGDEKPENNPIFLPSDHWLDWLTAKIYYQCAHAQYHELYTHYTSCHATMEAYAMGIQRNLPDPHPIFKLLRPFIRYTMAINTRARASLINDGGIIDNIFSIGGEGKREFFKRIGKQYNVHISNIKKFAEKRGVADSKKLPGYYYRDDGFKVWDSLEEYAGDVIKEFYKSDDEVSGDLELQAFADDLHTNGFCGFGEVPDGHGFPNAIKTLDELIELCTLIMFTGSAQHASVNFEQYEFYRYVPNAPFGVRKPPPSKKGEVDYQTLLECLPGEKATMLGVGVTFLLSQYSQNEKFLGDFTPRFTETRVTRYIERFNGNLQDISGDVLNRNKKLDIPYIGMLPEKIPNSITI